MSEELEFMDNTPPPGAEMTAVETWIAAITKPKVATFEQIAAQSGATTGKAFLWVALASLVTSFFSAVAQAVGAGQSMEMLENFLPPDVAYALPTSGSGMGIGAAICGAPLGAVFGVIGFAIMVGLIQWVAKLFGGTGSFEKLAYPFAAIMVPISAVNAVFTILGMIPLIGVLFGLVSIGVGIYGLVLYVLAAQAVNELDTGKAVASVFLPGLVIFIFVCCCAAIVIGGLAASGEAIGDVFNEINSNLY